MKNPCNECPFRKRSLPGYVGGHDDVIEILQIINFQDEKFPCHKAVSEIQNVLSDGMGNDCEDHAAMSNDAAFRQATIEAPNCVGSLAFLNNIGKLSRDPKIAAEQKTIGKRQDVFENPADFLEYHETKSEIGLMMIDLMKKHRAEQAKKGKKNGRSTARGTKVK